MGADNTCICCSPSSPQTKYLRVMDSLVKAGSLVVATICIHNPLQAYDVRCHSLFNIPSPPLDWCDSFWSNLGLTV